MCQVPCISCCDERSIPRRYSSMRRNQLLGESCCCYCCRWWWGCSPSCYLFWSFYILRTLNWICVCVSGRCPVPHHLGAPLGASAVSPPAASVAQPNADADEQHPRGSHARRRRRGRGGAGGPRPRCSGPGHGGQAGGRRRSTPAGAASAASRSPTAGTYMI